MPQSFGMNCDDFIRSYQDALASQSWALVDPLIHNNACVTFSNGTVHMGKAGVRSAYEANFATIKDEDYRIANVHWVRRDERIAVYLFDFSWRGRIDGNFAQGGGRGTAVLVREGSDWKLLVEHLGPPQPAVA